MKRKVIFRADGNSEIGLGHVVRCCALADMIREDFDCYFSVRNPSDAIEQQILKYASGVEKLDENISYEEEAPLWSKQLNGDEIVVLDGYHFSTSYQEKIKDRGCKLVCIDDIHSYHFLADIIINHSPSVNEKKYSKEAYTQLLSGTDYALLKKQFLLAAQEVRKSISNTNIFICFGGADPDNITLQTVCEIRKVSAHHFLHIVTGSAYQHQQSLDEFILNDKASKNYSSIDADTMLRFMQSSGTAIVSSSTIALEYVCTKGRLFLRQTADNQHDLYKALIEKGCAREYDKFFEGDLKDDREMLFNQSKLIDGKSAERIKKVFAELSASFHIKLSKAGKEDAETLFNWANQPSVRAQSHNNKEISFEEHLDWFSQKLLDKNCYLYLACFQHQPFGMIRFDVKHNEALISYLVDEHYRGKGLGKLLVKTGIETFLKESCFEGSVVASVKDSNIPSLKVFRHLGFEEREDSMHQDSVVFVK